MSKLKEEAFKVNIDDGTISVNQSNMNPKEVGVLIESLKSNLTLILLSRNESPLEVLTKSVRLKDGIISFNLGWMHKQLKVDVSSGLVPYPNVHLSDAELVQYNSILTAMIKSAAELEES